MGHKIHPRALRLGYIQNWDSMWYSDRNYAAYLKEDYDIRKFVTDKYRNAGLSKICIERHPEIVKIDIYTARPALVIGRRGQDKENLRNDLQNLINKNAVINVIEVLRPDLDAAIMAENLVFQLEKKVYHRKAAKRTMERSMEAGARGIKVMMSGRIGGAEIARTEWMKQGRVPLSTFRSDIDFASIFALTKYGKIGIKVWIYKDDVTKTRAPRPDKTVKGEVKEDAAPKES